MKKVGRLYREYLADRIRERVGNSSSTFLLNYTQVDSSRLSDLRKNLKKAGADVCVSKNSIARLVLKDMNFSEFSEEVKGQTAFVWSKADSVEVSKVLLEFIKNCENISVRGGLLEGRTLKKEDVKKLSDLPSKQILIATLLGTIQAPLTRLAGSLTAKSTELLSILKQLSEKKGGS